jgi:hypothetical protein
MVAIVRSSKIAVLAMFGSLGAGCVISGGAMYHGHGRHDLGAVDAAVVVGRPAPVYVAPAPVVVYQPPVEQVFVVRAAPPPLRVEARPRMPGAGYVWVSGSWAHQHGNWVWVAGRWDRPPRARAVWVPNRWERRGSEFHLVVGGWH